MYCRAAGAAAARRDQAAALQVGPSHDAVFSILRPIGDVCREPVSL